MPAPTLSLSFEAQIATVRTETLSVILPILRALPPNFDGPRLAQLTQSAPVTPFSKLVSSAGYCRVWWTSAAIPRKVLRAEITLSLPIFLHPSNLSATGSKTGLSPLQATLAHEYAHIAAANHCGSVDHGSWWQFFDLLFGDDGERCHTLTAPRSMAAQRLKPASQSATIPAQIEDLF